MDLQELVAQPTWREFLVEQVTTQRMDPWDIDVTALADAYLAKVRQIQSLDLRVPANVILASAILLGFKSQALRLDLPQEEAFEEGVEENTWLTPDQIPTLVYLSQRERTRRVTLDELITAMDRVLKDGPRRPVNISVPKALYIELPPETVEQRTRRVMSFAREHADPEKTLTLSRLVEVVMSQPKPGHFEDPAKAAWLKHEALVYCLVPLLHVSQTGEVQLWQEDAFGEVIVRLDPVLEPHPREGAA